MCIRDRVKDRTLDRLLHQMRRIKEPGELREMNTAQEITDAAFSHILAKIKEGITERELALEIEFFMRRNGAESVSFDLIVVSGKNGSLPHGVPEEKPVEKGDFITMEDVYKRQPPSVRLKPALPRCRRILPSGSAACIRPMKRSRITLSLIHI